MKGFSVNGLECLTNVGFSSEVVVTVAFIIHNLYKENLEILDYLDKNNTDKKVLLIYEQMEYYGLITKSETASMYSLTKDGLEVLKLLTKEKTLGDIDWIGEWLDLFPVKKPDGTYLRANEKDVKARMKSFIAEYGYSKEIIFEATQLYLNKESERDFNYCRTALYFIFKNESGSKSGRISDLASWCNNLEQEKKSGKTDVKKPFTTFI